MRSRFMTVSDEKKTKEMNPHSPRPSYLGLVSVPNASASPLLCHQAPKYELSFFLVMLLFFFFSLRCVFSPFLRVCPPNNRSLHMGTICGESSVDLVHQLGARCEAPLRGWAWVKDGDVWGCPNAAVYSPAVEQQ